MKSTTHIGNLEITKDNEKDFAELKEVTGYVYVYGSAKLDALTTVGGNVRVSGSAKLDAPKLETVGGDVRVYGSAKLDAPKLETVGGDVNVYGSAKLDAPKLTNKNDPKAAAKCAKKLELSFKKKNLIKVDGILSWLFSKKKIGTIVTMKVKVVGKLTFSFVIQKGEMFSHGKTIKEAKDSLKYKISSRDVSEFKKWKITEQRKVAEIIGAYRAITGACEFGVRDFCESKKLPAKMTIRQAIKLTEGKYGNEKFKEFFK